METIAALASQHLEWVTSSTSRCYELRAGNEVAATLQFRSLFKSLAIAKSSEACWTFKRMGLLHTRVTVRLCDSSDEVGTFKHNTWRGGGTLEMADGQVFKATTNLWQTKFEFQDASGGSLVQFKLQGLLRMKGTVTLAPGASDLAVLPLMAILGWYIIVVIQADAGASASATATS